LAAAAAAAFLAFSIAAFSAGVALRTDRRVGMLMVNLLTGIGSVQKKSKENEMIR
jgi:hypothetical protein